MTDIQRRAVQTLPESDGSACRDRAKLVLALGDSLYGGYRLPASQSFPAVLQQLLAADGIDAEVVNAGVSGNTSADGLHRLPSALRKLQRRPDLVLVGFGANDAFRGVPPGQTRRNLETIIVELRRRDIPVMLTGIAVPKLFQHPYFARFEAIYAELAAAYGVALEPSFREGVATRRDLLLPDGVHPNGAGVKKMARRVAPQVAALLRSVD